MRSLDRFSSILTCVSARANLVQCDLPSTSFASLEFGRPSLLVRLATGDYGRARALDRHGIAVPAIVTDEPAVPNHVHAVVCDHRPGPARAVTRVSPRAVRGRHVTVQHDALVCPFRVVLLQVDSDRLGARGRLERVQWCRD